MRKCFTQTCLLTMALCAGCYFGVSTIAGAQQNDDTPVVLTITEQAVISQTIIANPTEYPFALRNPHKGFTNGSSRENNPWATLQHCYIRWNEIENDEADGIAKIRAWCDANWKDVDKSNVKIIPRVYLHWDGDRKYWPDDLQADDYTSDRFVARVKRLVERLGECWDNDPRVAHIEMGIIGKWGEHHSPSPTPEVERMLAEAFDREFKNKLVLVRHPWEEFEGQSFGCYWDSWAHISQMDSHGRGILSMNDRWKFNIIGGEVAYNWGRYREQPGNSPTDTVVDPVHRNFLIDTIRSMHCTQLRWVANYDQKVAGVEKGANEIQKAFGYRFNLEEVSYPSRIETGVPFDISLRVKNVGSAPFYYDWPIELSLLDSEMHELIWRSTFNDVDIRKWQPGDHWDQATAQYALSPQSHTVRSQFNIEKTQKEGQYIIAISILDPGGNVPSLRFATANYFNGGRHPIGYIGIGTNPPDTSIPTNLFDNPANDTTLHYVP